jgi:hypothetical protein
MSSAKRKANFLKLMITVCQAELIGDQAAAATDGTLVGALTAKRKSLMFIAGRLSAYLQDNGVVVDSVLETLDTSRNLNLMQEKTNATPIKKEQTEQGRQKEETSGSNNEAHPAEDQIQNTGPKSSSGSKSIPRKAGKGSAQEIG